MSMFHLFNKTVSVRKAKKTTPPFGVFVRWTFGFLYISYTFQVAAKKIESQKFFFLKYVTLFKKKLANKDLNNFNFLELSDFFFYYE